MKKRYLTKSRFKLASECPAKLYYTKKDEYADTKLEDSFLMALAEGGFQVGELAKCVFLAGYDIKALGYEESLAETNELLKREKVDIFEAAISYQNLFIRVDVLRKNGNNIKLYEVKAKSFDTTLDDPFANKNGTIKANWKPYLYDVAFQKYVICKAFPEANVSAYLMMVDKTVPCPTEGLNQKFIIHKDSNGRKSVQASDKLSRADLDPPILCRINVDAECDQIYDGSDHNDPDVLSFVDRINFFAQHYELDEKIDAPIGSICRDCEFQANANQQKAGLKDGKKECWKEALNWKDADFLEPTVLDIWNFRKKDQLIDSHRIKISDVLEDDISPVADNKPGLSPKERQWLQIYKVQQKDRTPWVDRKNLSKEIESWTFPLHMIDFETTTVAIPFNKGRLPYEGIAFQFSHHIIYEDGTIAHRGQYLNTERGIFPNYDFIRALKIELEQDQGSIFCYSPHENTFLNLIYRQLKEDTGKIDDRDELCDFIKTMTHSTKNSAEEWCGDRDMVDMWAIVKRFYYDPATNGSNSIKQVLPAMLNSSEFLQEKYTQPIYSSDADNGIKSLNFPNNWRWIQTDNNGKIIDPYKLLPKMFQDVSENDLEILSRNDELRDGGAALTAYARMQFEEMSDYERDEIRKALLKYCELDTFAMVMLYEGWKDLLSK